MKKNLNAFLIIICLVISSTSLLATHNRAGEITFRQLSSNSIEITVTTFTKTSSIPADRDSINVCWGDNTTENLARINGPDPDGDGNGAGEILSNDYKMNIYKGIHNYGGLGQYYICVQDPNRNGGILNVNFPNSDQVVFYLETMVKLSSSAQLNNSPIILERPIDIAFLGQPFVHVPNAYDTDDDSIAYELITPMNGPGTTVPNYQHVDVISPGPNNTMSLDEETGVFSWDAPQRKGEYNIAILIKSYRNGELIDQMIRDMQILVIESENPAPLISAEIPSGDIIEVNLGDTVRASLSMSDISQQISISTSSGLYDYYSEPATFAVIENGNTGTVNFEWVVKEEHLRTQPYQAVFGVTDELGLAAYHVLRFKTVDQVSNTNKPSPAFSLELYPNPSAQRLHIQVPETVLPAKYRIANANGLIVRNGTFDATVTDLDISQLGSATYFLQVWNGSSFVTRAFVVFPK